MLSAVALGIALAQPEAFVFQRDWSPGEVVVHDVRARLVIESRDALAPTFIPSSQDLRYTTTLRVLEEGVDGIVDVRFVRPTLTIVEGETASRPPVTTERPMNEDLRVTLSPINEVLAINGPAIGSLRSIDASVSSATAQPVFPFMESLYRMALFMGDLDSSLDLSPKLPYYAIAPGSTWSRTVGFQPQGGRRGVAMQRLDYLYTYEGVVDGVHRVVARLDLDTDAAPFVNALLPRDAGLRFASVLLQLEAEVEFDLHLDTHKTLAARAESFGFVRLDTGRPGDWTEQRLSGSTTMTVRDGS